MLHHLLHTGYCISLLQSFLFSFAIFSAPLRFILYNKVGTKMRFAILFVEPVGFLRID